MPEAAGARILGNDYSFFSAPQLKRGPLGIPFGPALVGQRNVTPLFDWLPGFRRRRERAAAHAAAWAQEARTDGLKPFQVVAKERLDKVLTAIGAPIQWSIERTDSQEWGQSLVGRATTISLTVWLHDDTFSFTAGEKGDYLEWWDYDSPTAMIDEFSSRVEAEVRLHGMG